MQGHCGLLALHLAGGLIQGISQDGVLLLQPGQLSVGAILQLFLKSSNLQRHHQGHQNCPDPTKRIGFQMRQSEDI